MKKYFYSVLAASMLFACSQEDIVDVNQSESQQVTFKVEIPASVASRTVGGVVIGAGTQADKLIYAMYEEDQNEILVAGVESEVTEGTFEVKVPMAKDLKYDILFLAYNPENNIFGISADIDTEEEAKTVNLKNLTLKQELLANQESYDAFIGSLDSKGVDAASATNVTLYRPFAQVNAATTSNDLNDADKLNAEVTKSYIKVYNAPTKLNVFNGAVSDLKTFEYKLAGILNKDGQNEYPNETITVGTDTYYYLAMAYVLAGNTSTTCDADFSFYRADSKLVSSLQVKNMPIQANYRTNVLGTLLTQKENYKIEIDAVFGTPDKNDMIVVEKSVVEDATDLVETIQAITEDKQNAPDKTLYVIEVEGDIKLGAIQSNTYSRAAAADCITIPAGKSVKIDLKGHNITGIDNATGSFGLINLAAGSNLSIINSSTTEGMIALKATTERNWNAYSSVISNQCATLTVGANVVVVHQGGTAMAYGIDNLTNTGAEHAKTTIEGATIKSTYRAIRQFLNSSAEDVNNELYVNSGTIESTEGNKSIWMQDANKNANPGKLIVSADAALKGDVYLTVTAGSTEWPVEVSIAAAALKEGATVLSNDNVPYDYKVVEQDGVWTVQLKDAVAKIGKEGFTTLQKAVNAVQDGETITLIADEIFTEKNYYDNGGYKDGLGYSGDKSFTIDLDGHTIKQNGALNDYLIWIKNVGSKENEITIKNGTLDAGTTAYCALCTASSHENQLIVNLENVTLVNNISNGSTVKIRAGSVLNVNAGTKITGKNSYLGIENWNATVNIYDGAEIYMNGTSSYNGCLVGVGGNGTINVYGGYGKGVSGGLIAMTSGGTINVSGGEWIANTDGTFANSNKSVLIAQSDKQYNAGAGNAVVNVTGGTFKGGYNCYGNAVGDAQINIKGGNFNADPTKYVVAGYEVTGNYTVGKPKAVADLEAAIAKGGNVTLANDVTLLESLKIENTVVLDLNGQTITAPLFSAFEVKTGGELTIKNGKVVAYESTVRAIGGKATIESGEYTSTGTALDSPSTYRYSLDCREGGELIVNGGTFKSNNGLINVGSTVTINGGKFENIVEKSMTRHFAYVSAPLTINDGEFYGKANSSAGGCFFCGAAASGDIQIKGGKFTSLWTSGSVNRIFEVYFGGTINVTGGMFNTNGGIATFVTENTDEATKAAYPYVAK